MNSNYFHKSIHMDNLLRQIMFFIVILLQKQVVARVEREFSTTNLKIVNRLPSTAYEKRINQSQWEG